MPAAIATFHTSWTSLFTTLGTGLAILVAWGLLLVLGRNLRDKLSQEDPELGSKVGSKIRWGLLAALVVVALWLAVDLVPGVPAGILPTVDLAARVLLITLAAYVVGEALIGLTSLWAQRHGARTAQTAFTRYLLYAVIYGLALVMVMNEMGLAITPLVTALGVGGIAVALALQETLSNLFAGLYLVVDKSVQIGDWIELEDGRSGYVEEMTWRAIRMHTVADNTILVPNHIIATTVVQNAGLPNQEIGVTVPISVALDSDVDEVERVAKEVAGWVQTEIGQGPEGFEPSVRFHGIGPVGIQFTTILKADESFEHHELKHWFIKRLIQRFEAEGIELAVHPDMQAPEPMG